MSSCYSALLEKERKKETWRCMQYKDVCCDAPVHASMLYSPLLRLSLLARMLWMNPIKGYSQTEKALVLSEAFNI